MAEDQWTGWDKAEHVVSSAVLAGKAGLAFCFR
jgi:uncharacterized protein YfiM (DUF2279 family)